MGFKSIKDIVDADLEGRTREFSFRKTPSQTTVSGCWFDLSMSPGNPVPNYYAASPLISVALRQSTDGGFFHGANAAPLSKYLITSLIVPQSATGLPMPLIMLDYLLYYPFIDEGTTDEQIVTNSVSLPRYTNGEGVKIMAVSVAARTSGQTFTVKYTNSNGVSGRVTTAVFQNSAGANGSIISSHANSVSSNIPFLPLQGLDTGVRYIESVTMAGADVGLFTLVLVKPIMQTCVNEQTACVEVNFAKDKSGMPKIEDDAYLNFICTPQGNISGTTLIGTLKYTWG